MRLCRRAIERRVPRSRCRASLRAMNGISAVADGTAVELNGNRFVLRPHQQEALDSLFDVWRARDRALVVMPCGSGHANGKTAC